MPIRTRTRSSSLSCAQDTLPLTRTALTLTRGYSRDSKLASLERPFRPYEERDIASSSTSPSPSPPPTPSALTQTQTQTPTLQSQLRPTPSMTNDGSGSTEETHSSVDEIEDALRDVLNPLPDDTYPRVFDGRTPTKGYWVAMGLVLAVWVITPLSCVYIIWYILLGRGHAGSSGLTATLFAAYAVTEVFFSIYHHYLVRFVQVPGPPSTLSLEMRNQLFSKVLHAGLTYPLPSRPPRSDDPDKQMQRLLYERYERGEMTAAEYYHQVDREYEEAHGMQVPRRVGKMTEADKAMVQGFVEESTGEREERLIKEIEGGIGVGDTVGGDGIKDKEGNRVALHPQDRRAVEFRERLRTWFDHAPWESIKRENVLHWLAWSCFNLPLDQALANPDWSSYLEETYQTLEDRTGTKFPEGYNSHITVMRLSLDQVNAKGRPLILYALTNAINWFLREVVYPYQGLAMYREGDVEYLVRIPPGWTPERGMSHPNCMPVVYLHGLGFGLLQSHLLIKHLIRSLPTHPLIIPLSPYTSQSFFHERHLRPWTRPEFMHAIKAICKKWGLWEETLNGQAKGGVSLLSHSNGSVAHGWILKDCPSLARRNVFVDPVVFCLWEGDVCQSFCYRKPATALELLLYYFIACEVGIANYIQRHFDWADNTLFFEDIPEATDPTKTAFFLGGKDIILDATRVRRYLQGREYTHAPIAPGVRGIRKRQALTTLFPVDGVTTGIHWQQNGGHGDGLSGASRDQVVMFAGTGSTRGWQGWLSEGRRRHSLGLYDFHRRQGRRRGPAGEEGGSDRRLAGAGARGGVASAAGGGTGRGTGGKKYL